MLNKEILEFVGIIGMNLQTISKWSDAQVLQSFGASKEEALKNNFKLLEIRLKEIDLI